jgi:hypothetical protein
LVKADYDSEADALSITLARFKRYDHQEAVDDDNCHVELSMVPLSILRCSIQPGTLIFFKLRLTGMGSMAPLFSPVLKPRSRLPIAS